MNSNSFSWFKLALRFLLPETLNYQFRFNPDFLKNHNNQTMHGAGSVQLPEKPSVPASPGGTGKDCISWLNTLPRAAVSCLRPSQHPERGTRPFAGQALPAGEDSLNVLPRAQEVPEQIQDFCIPAPRK